MGCVLDVQTVTLLWRGWNRESDQLRDGWNLRRDSKFRVVAGFNPCRSVDQLTLCIVCGVRKLWVCPGLHWELVCQWQEQFASAVTGEEGIVSHYALNDGVEGPCLLRQDSGGQKGRRGNEEK